MTRSQCVQNPQIVELSLHEAVTRSFDHGARGSQLLVQARQVFGTASFLDQSALHLLERIQHNLAVLIYRFGKQGSDPLHFGAATPVVVPAPAEAGTAQSAQAVGLPLEARVYFALRTFDAGGNFSGLSNVASMNSGAVAPATPGDLQAVTDGADAVVLTWTATGDDGDQGRASAYDLRYATAPIDSDAAFAAARFSGVRSGSTRMAGLVTLPTE